MASSLIIFIYDFVSKTSANIKQYYSQKNNNFAKNLFFLMTKKQASTDDLISVIIKGIDEVKGENIQLLDLREIENTVCDYFVICSGNSNTQVNAISGSVQKTGK